MFLGQAPEIVTVLSVWKTGTKEVIFRDVFYHWLDAHACVTHIRNEFGSKIEFRMDEIDARCDLTTDKILVQDIAAVRWDRDHGR